MAGLRRREFIAAAGSTAMAWPFAARGQPPAMPVIGFLNSGSASLYPDRLRAFRQGLGAAGYAEGRNVVIEFKWAESQYNRLPALVTELIHRPVAVIVGNHDPALAAKAAIRTVPIAFATGGDPVLAGLVTSLNRPGGNVTGVHFLASVLGAKRLELLAQVVPRAATIAMLSNANSPDTEAERRDVQAAAQAVGQQIVAQDVSNDREIETAFATFLQRGAGALLAGTGGFLFSHGERLVALSARHRLPASCGNRETAMAGGLISYGADKEAARMFGRQVLVLPAGTPSEIDTTFATLRQRRATALLVGSAPFFTGRRQQIVALAARDAIPAMYINREFVADGGLMSCGNNPADAYRRAGVYAGRILKGASPSELPIDQATKFEFVINLKTAKALGLEIPPTLLARADEIIE
jgi:putative ABC transport system substrate-binding protein